MKTSVNRGIVAVLAVVLVLSLSWMAEAHGGQQHAYTSGKTIPQNINNILNKIGDTCPLTGAPITDAENKITYKGEEVLLCCSDCKTQFDALPELQKPQAFKDIKNHQNGDPLVELGGTHNPGDAHSEDDHQTAAEQGHTDGDSHTVGQHVTGLVVSTAAAEPAAAASGTSYKLCRNNDAKTFTCSESCLSNEVIDTLTEASYSDCTELCSEVVKGTDYECNTPSSTQSSPAAPQETKCASAAVPEAEGVCKSPQECAGSDKKIFGSSQCSEDEMCCFSTSDLPTTVYKLCLNDASVMSCYQSDCPPEGYTDVTPSGTNFYTQDICEGVCRDTGNFIVQGSTCAYSRTSINLCRYTPSGSSAYTYRCLESEEGCADYGYELADPQTFYAPQDCEDRKNELQPAPAQQPAAPVAGQQPAQSGAACERACGRADTWQCVDSGQNPNYQAYSSYRGSNYYYDPYNGRYNYNYGSGGFTTRAYGQFVRKTGTNLCTANKECWCYDVGVQIGAGLTFVPEAYTALTSEKVKEKAFDSIEDRTDMRVMNPPVVINTGKIAAGYVDDITCDVSVKFGGSTISRIQNCNANVDSRSQPLFISEGDTSSIELSGMIGTRSAHCNGLTYTCLAVRDASCRFDEDWKNGLPRSGYKPNDCRESQGEITLAKKSYMKTNYGKILAIGCFAADISAVIGACVASGGTTCGEAVKTGAQFAGLCTGLWSGSSGEPKACSVNLQFRPDGVGITGQTGSQGSAVSVSTFIQYPQGGGSSPQNAGQQPAPTGKATAGGTLGGISRGVGGFAQNYFAGNFLGACLGQPGFSKISDKCYSVCATKARSPQPSEAPSCPVVNLPPLIGSFPIYDDSEEFRSPLYGTYTGPTCPLADVPVEDNPLQQVMVVVTTPGGERKLAVPAPHGVIGTSITPADLGFSGNFASGGYEISIRIPENALEPIADVGGSGG